MDLFLTHSLLGMIAVTDTPASRALVTLICCVVGGILVLVGRMNIKTQRASESGKRRLVAKMMGGTGDYEGSSAVTLGVVRVIAGIAVIVFGIVFLFVGPFLAK